MSNAIAPTAIMDDLLELAEVAEKTALTSAKSALEMGFEERVEKQKYYDWAITHAAHHFTVAAALRAKAREAE